MRVKFYLYGNKDFDLSDYTSKEEARQKLDELIEDGNGLVIADAVIGDYIDEHVGSDNVAGSYNLFQITDAFFDAFHGSADNLERVDEKTDRKARLFCAICSCEGMERGISVLCEDPYNFDENYNFYPDACSSSDIIYDVFDDIYPEEVARVESLGLDPLEDVDLSENSDLWSDFKIAFVTGPFFGCENYGAYCEKEAYKEFSSELPYDYNRIDSEIEQTSLTHKDLLKWRSDGRPENGEKEIPQPFYGARMNLLSREDRELLEKKFVQGDSEKTSFKAVYFGNESYGKPNWATAAMMCVDAADGDVDTAMRLFKGSAAYDWVRDTGGMASRISSSAPDKPVTYSADEKYRSFMNMAAEFEKVNGVIKDSKGTQYNGK